jgi:hypothetical protein
MLQRHIPTIDARNDAVIGEFHHQIDVTRPGAARSSTSKSRRVSVARSS